MIPTLNEAKADPWPPGTQPTPAAGLAATAYGIGLDHPRWLYVLPNGDVLVAETNKPEDAPKETGNKAGETSISAQGAKVLDLPAGINHHWTKNVIASPDGKELYITVGSNSNVGENGMEAEAGRAFYGWPYSYNGQHVDTRVKPQQPDMVARAIAPDYGLGAHTASPGMTFYDASLLPPYKSGALVSQHGSWNRKPRASYELVFVPFTNGKPSGPPQEVLKGFLSEDGRAYGRPVGVAVDKSGAILLADDVGNRVWRIAPASK